jgi:ornithine decarboxylase
MSPCLNQDQLLNTPTPYFLIDPEEIRQRIAAFRGALPTAAIFYALKSNPDPIVLRTVADAGCGFEAASWPEIELLLTLGVAPARIIYGTAVKPKRQIERAVSAGVVHFAADSIEELNTLAQLAPGAKVYVRAHVDDSRSVFQMSGKFGAPANAVVALVSHASGVGLQPWGISFNVGSQARHFEAWAEGINTVAPMVEELLQDHDLKLEVLNLGGGFPAKYRNQADDPEMADIAQVIQIAMDRLPYQPELIIEPGRGVVATSTSLIASVVARIERGTDSWLYLDAGVYNALFEALSFQGALRYPVSTLVSTDVAGGRIAQQRFILAGPTGDALDVIDRDVELPMETTVGDRIRFDNAGAYTLAMASSFNGFPKPVTYERQRSSVPNREGQTPIDTHDSRVAIGFPEDPSDWCRAPAIFTEDSLRILNHPVMEDWERGYMRALAQVATADGGTVLELGYGLGLSTSVIQSAPTLDRHVIIECHPDVVAKCLSEWREAIASQRLQLLVGLWQEVTPLLADASFDGILFDTYPLAQEEIHQNHFSFFAEAHRLLKPGGVLTYYSDEVDSPSNEHLCQLIDAGFSLDNIGGTLVDVQPPQNCEYWQANTLLLPVVRK